MPSDPALVHAVMHRWEIADYGNIGEDLARMAVQAVLKAQAPEREELERKLGALEQAGQEFFGALNVGEVARSDALEEAIDALVDERSAREANDA